MSGRIISVVLILVSWLGAANARAAEDLEPVAVRNNFGAAITLLVPRSAIQPNELAVIINDADPQSVDVGNYYAAKNRIPFANVIHVRFPAGTDTMTTAVFATLESTVKARVPANVQGYAITWTKPFRVGAGMGMTSALTLGYNSRYVASSVCNTTAAVPYYNSTTTRPYSDLGLRPAMMVAGASAASARALVDRGARARQNLPQGDGYFFRTTDATRSVRANDFSATVSTWNKPGALRMRYIDNSSGTGLNYIEYAPSVLFYLTGLPSVPGVMTNRFAPGAVADHLTSAGGYLSGGSQMNALRWLDAGATASYGTVVEPCNYTQKFPVASILVRKYFDGATVLESYWKSVNQPGEGVFVGDPLARPFGTKASFVNGILQIDTTLLRPGKTYTLLGADYAQGPFYVLRSDIRVWATGFRRISQIASQYRYYKLTDAAVAASAPRIASLSSTAVADGGSGAGAVISPTTDPAASTTPTAPTTPAAPPLSDPPAAAPAPGKPARGTRKSGDNPFRTRLRR